MKRKDFKSIVGDVVARCLSVLKEKSADYSAVDNVLKGFKDGAAISKIRGLDINNPEHRAIYELDKRVSRMINLGHRGNKEEKQFDLVVDAINHLYLYLALWIDEEYGAKGEVLDENNSG